MLSLVKSFAQFACVEYKNTAGVGYPYAVVKAMSFILNLLPNFHITSGPPKYEGYNASKDNAVYEILRKHNPNMFKSSTKVLNATL